jgi:non-canonical poly(A) RNA polymerase PAPD5/7
MQSLNTLLDSFNDEVKAFADYILPTSPEHSLRELIIKEIEFYARKIWPDATATAFGSYATNLYLPTG